MERSASASHQTLPAWFRQDVPDCSALERMRSLLRETGLHTVCEGAACPNLGQCWNKGTATFMILGDTCTRGCRFCAVPMGKPSAVRFQEPEDVAQAVKALRLHYAVITSVTRDDLADEGAGQFARVVRVVKEMVPGVKVEVLIPDCHARVDLLKIVSDSRPDVMGHNVETVRRLSPALRPQADHDRSLKTLAALRALAPERVIKSGFMVGLGETDEEVYSTFDELKAAGCDVVTVGQYLTPTKTERHWPAARYVDPAMFEQYRAEGLRHGLRAVVAGPLVRSSYLAEQYFQECLR